MDHQVFIVNGTDIITGLTSLLAFSAGYFFKGVVFAILSEAIYKPIAKWLLNKGEEWEQTHPQLLKWLRHFSEGHTGKRPSVCMEGQCPQ